MGSEINSSQNTADSCYKDPSAEGCRSFRRDHMDVVADRDSLCAAMDFMVGCTLSHECTVRTTQHGYARMGLSAVTDVQTHRLGCMRCHWLPVPCYVV